MNAFVLNRHGRVVFPSNIMPELDFSAMESLDQLDNVIRRDFETKAPSGTDILEKVRTGGYDSRYTLMRDLALNMFWANRFSITMYDKRPTRWADVPRNRADVFLPVLEPWEDGETKMAAVQAAYPALTSGTPPGRPPTLVSPSSPAAGGPAGRASPRSRPPTASALCGRHGDREKRLAQNMFNARSRGRVCPLGRHRSGPFRWRFPVGAWSRSRAG